MACGNGKYLLGGILVGEADEYNMLKQVVNNKMTLPETPEDFILGAGCRFEADAPFPGWAERERR